jgi:ubiquinone/menaquinone biosynthesis C-methylase UbiE
MVEESGQQEQHAEHEYDKRVKEYGWVGSKVAFGLAYEYTSPGQTILDLGIGTGLGSVLFYRAGMFVYGLDNSDEMLNICQSKGFAYNLQLHDMNKLPYLYGGESLDHAVCIGVLQYFENIQPVIEEVARIIRESGVFVFTVMDRSPSESAAMVLGPEITDSGSTDTIYRHSTAQIREYLQTYGFESVKSLEFNMFMDREHRRKSPVKTYVAMKRNITRAFS